MANLTDIMLKTAKYGAYRKGGSLVQLDARSAAELMLRFAPRYRTPWEKLTRFVQDAKADGLFPADFDLEAALVQGMSANHPDVQKDSLKKNIRNWKKSTFKNSIDREYIVEFCFIFGLTPQAADELMLLMRDEGFHWRSPRDIACLYALKKKMTYPQALALIERVMPSYEAAAKACEGEIDEQAMTGDVKNEAQEIDSEEELSAYLVSEAKRLGVIRHTAREEFLTLMDTLKNAPVSYTEEKRLEQREIVTRYLHRNMVPVRQKKKRAAGETVKYERKKYSLQDSVAQAIGESWPSDSAVSSMTTGMENVSRKVLILLALATDFEDTSAEDVYAGFLSGAPDEPAFDGMQDLEEMTPAERFEYSRSTIDEMLIRCGFSALDPRRPFDWMILYCLGVGDAFDIDRQMENILGEIFETGSEKQFEIAQGDTMNSQRE